MNNEIRMAIVELLPSERQDLITINMLKGETRCPQRVANKRDTAPDNCAFGDQTAIVFGEADPPGSHEEL